MIECDVVYVAKVYVCDYSGIYVDMKGMNITFKLNSCVTLIRKEIRMNAIVGNWFSFKALDILSGSCYVSQALSSSQICWRAVRGSVYPVHILRALVVRRSALLDLIPAKCEC